VQKSYYECKWPLSFTLRIRNAEIEVMDKLFALDESTNEVVVSESPKGSNSIKLVERINRGDDELLFQAVSILTMISKSPNFDAKMFKAMDRVCQLIYKGGK